MNTFIVIPTGQIKKYDISYFVVNNPVGILKLRKALNKTVNLNLDNFNNTINVDNLNIFLQSPTGNIYPFFIKKVTENQEEKYQISIWVFNSSLLDLFTLKEFDNNFIMNIEQTIRNYEDKGIIKCTNCKKETTKTSNKHGTGIYCYECWPTIYESIKYNQT